MLPCLCEKDVVSSASSPTQKPQSRKPQAVKNQHWNRDQKNHSKTLNQTSKNLLNTKQSTLLALKIAKDLGLVVEDINSRVQKSPGRIEAIHLGDEIKVQYNGFFGGFTWIYMNLHEFTWIYMNLHEFTWIYMNLHEFTWIHMNSHEFTWIHMNLHEFTWIHMNLHEFTFEFTSNYLQLLHL